MNYAKKILSLSLCSALLVIAASYVLLTSARDGHLSIAESDQILYLQYAKNLATGSPLVFSPGDTPSSGSTTYLYTLLLSGIYRLGIEGNSVLIASYVINSLFYLASIILIWSITKKMIPKALSLVMTLTVLSGHMASAILKQTDIGLFTFLTLALFSSLLYKRHKTAWLLIMLCAATRPEGFVFSISFALCWLIEVILYLRSKKCPGNKPSKYFLFYAVSGGLVFFITLCINHALTGQFQFMSVQDKGYFTDYPLAGAIQHTLIDALSILRGVFMGLQENYRQFYFFPALAGLFGFLGILMKSRKDRHIIMSELWLFLCALGALALISSSQFAGVSNDRYLGWLMPLWIIYIACGWESLSARAQAPSFAPISAAFLIGFQLFSLAMIASETYGQAVAMESERVFSSQLKSTIPSSHKFGATEGNGINFFMPEHTVYNLWGITSPDFSYKRDTQSLRLNVDLLKHRKDLRFDYWLSTEQTLKTKPWMAPLFGERILTDKDTALRTKAALSVYRSKWDSLDGGEKPVLWQQKLSSKKIIDSMDVGYVVDEESHNYHQQLRLKDTRLTPIVTTDKLDELNYTEGGRIILGSESFSVHSVDEKLPLIIVLRTGIKSAGDIYFNRQASPIKNLEFNMDMNLSIYCDSLAVPCPILRLNESGYSEIILEIPAEFIHSPTPRIIISGDHISYAYWFYQ